MTTKLKRIFAAFFAAAVAALSASLLPVGADSLEGPSEVISDGAFEYEKTDGGYIIKKCTASIITKIPDVQNGIRIIGIGDEAFSGMTTITELTIPDTIKSIGKYAFLGCTSLKSVTLPKRLETLGESAFAGCSLLESVTIPDTLSEIPSGTFRKCDHLTEVNIPDNITKIGSYAFYQCTSLPKVTLPDSLVSVGEMAFGEMLSIAVFDTDGCAAYVFEDNMLMDQHKSSVICATSKLEGAVEIPATVTGIEPGAFSACPAITELTIPATVKTIGYGAFSSQIMGTVGYCSAINKISFAEGLEYIGEGAFSYCSAESLLLPSTLKEIGAGAFSGCYKLNRLVIPEGVESIGESAFMLCPELKSVSIPKSVKNIGENAFGITVKDGQLANTEGFSMSVASGSAGEKYAKNQDLDYTVSDKSLLKAAFVIVAVGLIAAAVIFGIVLMARSKKSASSGARKAKKLAKEQAEAENYKKIVDDDPSDK